MMYENVSIAVKSLGSVFVIIPKTLCCSVVSDGCSVLGLQFSLVVKMKAIVNISLDYVPFVPSHDTFYSHTSWPGTD